jgi:WD repeat-containing protein 92
VENETGLKCSTFGASASEARTIATGDFGGALSIWDMETLSSSSTPSWRAANAHHGLVNCIDGIGGLDQGHGAPELATGGRDGVCL